MKILLIQMLRLGDALQMIPIIRGLKTRFPGCTISVLTSTVGKKVFETDPAVDEVYVLDKQKIADLVGRATKKDVLSALVLIHSELEPLFAVHWDWVINFSFSYPSALLSFLLNAERRSGFVVNAQRQYLSREKWFALSLASFTHRRYSNFNWVDINRNTIDLPSVPRHPLLQPSDKALDKASIHLKRIGFEGKRIIGINPGASGAYKMWPVEKFGSLGRSLANTHDFRILIFGGKEETGLGRALKDILGHKGEDLTGNTTLEELAAFLSLCDVLVTNDTGPMHLAYSVGTRVISLFFNSHFVETGPYGPGHVAVHPDIPCFPCQGPAKCKTKDCLIHISPETIEKIILNGGSSKELPHINAQDTSPVQVHVSDFDPWEVLEWSPQHRPPLSLIVLERILLRVSWLSLCGVINDDGRKELDYLSLTLNRYSPPENRKEFISELTGLGARLTRFKARLEEAHDYASKIYMEVTGRRPDASLISSLGSKLGIAEKELFSIEENSSISFVGELLKVYLEEIELSNLEDLSRKTLSAYHEILRFTDLMTDRIDVARELLSERT